MFSPRLYFRILIHIILILGISGIGLYGIISEKAIILGCICLLLSLALIRTLVSFLNTTNHRISLFLDAIQDNESMLFFPETSSNQNERQLYAAFNRVNTLISKLKAKGRSQELFHKTILQYIPAGVVTWNNQETVLIANQEALCLLGKPQLKQRYQLDDVLPELFSFIGKGSGTSGLLQLSTVQFTRQLAASYNQMILQDETIHILTLKDISRELTNQETESWDKLTHVLTHEIMNSIAPIVSLSDTLLSYYSQDRKITEKSIEKTKRGLDTIKYQGERLVHFTESYRKLSFLPHLVIKPINIAELLQKLQLLFQADLDKAGIEFSINLPYEDPIVKADEKMLSQVLINLLKNAMQALENTNPGKINIKVTQDEITCIEITDNGPGISDNLMKKIFIPFFTTKTSGTGIGLSLSRQIITLHGGELQVSSVPFQSTCFKVLLP